MSLKHVQFFHVINAVFSESRLGILSIFLISTLPEEKAHFSLPYLYTFYCLHILQFWSLNIPNSMGLHYIPFLLEQEGPLTSLIRVWGFP